jgi:membrane protease YdiL (CAAX protease family)
MIGERRRALVATIALAIVSIGLISLIDEPCYALAQRFWPSLAWIAHARLTSFTAIAALYAWVAMRWPVTTAARHWRHALALGAGWIVVAATFIAVTRGADRGAVVLDAGDKVSLLITSLWAEELLFRGALFRLGERALPSIGVVAITAFCAAVSHWQYHHFEFSPAAGKQIALSVPGCVVYSLLRRDSGGPWLSGGVHFLNNLITLLLG